MKQETSISYLPSSGSSIDVWRTVGELGSVEIGPESHVDAVVLRHAGGEEVCSVGAGLVGPIRGPISVRGWHPVPLAAVWAGSPAPVVHLVGHVGEPRCWALRRAPMRGALELAPDGEIVVPWYGRARGELVLCAVASGSHTVRLEGRRYRSSSSSLVDVAVLTESITVGSAAAQSARVEGEGWDAVAVVSESPGASPLSVRWTARDA